PTRRHVRKERAQGQCCGRNADETCVESCGQEAHCCSSKGSLGSVPCQAGCVGEEDCAKTQDVTSRQGETRSEPGKTSGSESCETPGSRVAASGPSRKEINMAGPTGRAIRVCAFPSIFVEALRISVSDTPALRHAARTHGSVSDLGSLLNRRQPLSQRSVEQGLCQALAVVPNGLQPRPCKLGA